MPSSPDECTATPNWNASQMPAAFTHDRVEEDHIHRGLEHVGRQLLEPDDDGIRGQGHADALAHAPHAVQPVHRILEVVVVQVLDVPAEPDGLLRRPDPVGVEAQAVVRERGREGPIAFQLVARWKHAALEFVGAESALLFQGTGLGDELLQGPHLAGAVYGVGVAEEQVRRERHLIAQAAPEDLGYRHAPGLAQHVEAGELDGGEELRPLVVQRRGRIGDEEAQLFDPPRVAPDEVRFQGLGRGARALATTPQLPQAHEAGVGLDLDDRPHEAAPVAAVGVAQRRLERYGDGGRANVGNLHSDKLT